MAENKQTRIIVIFEGLVVSLGATVSNPEVDESHREIGRVYLEASREWLNRIRGDQGPEIAISVSDPHLDEIGERYSNLTGLVREQQWGPALRESHALLARLPGKPWFEPIKLPPPPRRA